MMQRNWSIAQLGSVVLLAMFVGIFVAGFYVNPWRQYVSFGESLHASVWNCGLDSRIVIFNDSTYGPYRGSIIGVVGATAPRVNAFGDAYGIYYRHFQWPDATLWTLMISMWYPLVVCALISITAWARRRRRRS